MSVASHPTEFIVIDPLLVDTFTFTGLINRAPCRIAPDLILDGRYVLPVSVVQLTDAPFFTAFRDLLGLPWLSGVPYRFRNNDWISPAIAHTASLSEIDLADLQAASEEEGLTRTILKVYENTIMLNCCDFIAHTHT